MKFLIVDDRVLSRVGLRMLLDQIDLSADIMESSNFAEALACDREEFDVIFFGMNQPIKDGFEGLQKLQGRFADTPIVVLSDVTNKKFIHLVKAVGARSFISKLCDSAEMLKALRCIVCGGEYFPCADRAVEIKLTPRQRDVLMHLVKGRTTREISQHLNVSGNTVRTHIAAIFDVLGVRNRTEAAVMAGALPYAQE